MQKNKISWPLLQILSRYNLGYATLLNCCYDEHDHFAGDEQTLLDMDCQNQPYFVHAVLGYYHPNTDVREQWYIDMQFRKWLIRCVNHSTTIVTLSIAKALFKAWLWCQQEKICGKFYPLRVTRRDPINGAPSAQYYSLNHKPAILIVWNLAFIISGANRHISTVKAYFGTVRYCWLSLKME